MIADAISIHADSCALLRCACL